MDAVIGRPLVRPVIHESAFDDPEEVRAIIADLAPYPSVWSMLPEGYGGEAPMRWFNKVWAVAECAQHAGLRRLIDNAVFLAGARESFAGFDIVRPAMITLNLTAEQSGGPHVDLPTFRGLDRDELPIWLGMRMAYSQLFDRWHIDQASALAWIYDGRDGGLAYWAHGPDQPPTVLTMLDNRVLVSDNQRMLHAVLPFGNADRRGPVRFSRAAVLRPDRDGGWLIDDGGVAAERYARDEIRINLLWTAQVFRDARAAAVYDDHSDDLSLERAVAILSAGARARGVTVPDPQVDPREDVPFMQALAQAFPKPRPHGVADMVI